MNDQEFEAEVCKKCSEATYFLNDLRGSVPNVNSVEVTKDLTDLFFRKGQLAIMGNILNLEAQLESVIEERNNPQDNDQEEAA